MNKFNTIILSILGGIDVTLKMFTPIILAALWVIVIGLNNWTTYFFYAMGLLATLFRAIKLGGWLRR